MSLRTLLLPLVLLVTGVGAAQVWAPAGVEDVTEAPATPDVPSEAEEGGEDGAVDGTRLAGAIDRSHRFDLDDARAPSKPQAVQTPPPER